MRIAYSGLLEGHIFYIKLTILSIRGIVPLEVGTVSLDSFKVLEQTALYIPPYIVKT